MICDDLSEPEAAHLRRSFALAKKAAAKGNMPFGAVIVAADGRVVAEAENSTAVDKDIASHAEINAIRKVCASGAQDRLIGATIFTSCLPCPMCCGAAIRFGLRRIVYGANWESFAASSLPAGSVAFGASIEKMAQSADPPLIVVGPCLAEEAEAALAERRAD